MNEMKVKIKNLRDRIRRDFPDGCDKDCEDCVLDGAAFGSGDATLCDMLFDASEEEEPSDE